MPDINIDYTLCHYCRGYEYTDIDGCVSTRIVNGVVGLAFWLAFYGLFVWCAVATRRHDRKTELDIYERMRGGGWG